MNNKVWLITGAGRGMGVDITKAALAAGHKVVATGRNTENVAKALGENENLFIVKLDVTKQADAKAAVNAAVERFGRIDVLVNNAANFMAGFFEELTQEEIEQQLQTSLSYDCNPCCSFGNAQAMFRAYHCHLFNCRTCQLRVL